MIIEMAYLDENGRNWEFKYLIPIGNGQYTYPTDKETWAAYYADKAVRDKVYENTLPNAKELLDEMTEEESYEYRDRVISLMTDDEIAFEQDIEKVLDRHRHIWYGEKYMHKIHGDWVRYRGASKIYHRDNAQNCHSRCLICLIENSLPPICKEPDYI